MPIAQKPGGTFPYVLEDDRELPKEEQTIFHLKRLNVDELSQVEDAAANYDLHTEKIGFGSGTQTVTILQLGLHDVENYKDEDGKDVKIEFEKQRGSRPTERKVSKEFLATLIPKHRRELANAITEQNSLTEEETGN